MTPDLPTLFALFPPADGLPAYEIVPPDAIPEPYRSLLVHGHHMTVTVEAHHGDLVDVRVLNFRLENESYAREILLTLQKTGKVVQYGIVRINLRFVNREVRNAILAGDTPLGRILIQNDVLRRIEPTAFLRVVPSPELVTRFGLPGPMPTYGRLALIHCDGKPAIELLEIVAPE